MTSEIIDMVELGLSSDVFEYDGEHFKQPRSSINVKPLQQPVPPIYYAGGDPGHLRKIAKGDHTLFISGVLGGVSRMKRMREQFEQAAIAVNKQPDEVKIDVSRLAFVSKNKKAVDHFIDSARYQQRLATGISTCRTEVCHAVT